MLKRPLDPRFTAAVMNGRKVTTIREKPWPVWQDIMLYNWTGAAYRSKHADVAVIKVMETTQMEISHLLGGKMEYVGVGRCGTRHPLFLILPYPHVLWRSEGFESQEEMDAWFRKVVKPGEMTVKHLMRFSLANA